MVSYLLSSYVQERKTMANKCDICGKAPQTGSRISHSHVRTKRRWLPNIQKIKVIHGGRSMRLNVCTKCLKAGKVKRIA